MNYIKVNDDDDGVVIVEDYEGGIKSFSYNGGYEKKQARRAGEKLAERVAKEKGCDWGCNY
jgi:hypothetical protein